MAETVQRRPSLAPRHWGGWLMVGFIWLLGSMPRPLGRLMIRPLGAFLRLVMASRRRVAERNLEACFPDSTELERRAMLRGSFRSIARMLLEMAWCWARPPERLQDMIDLAGFEHVEAAVKTGRGILMVAAHFTCLEIGAMALGHRVPTGRGVYRPLGNEVVEWYQNRGRAQYAGGMISKRDLRGMVRFLRSGGYLWYAPDQDFGPRQSVFAPFFGIQTATLLATQRLPVMTGCLVMTMFPHFDRETGRYRVEVSPPIEGFPSGDAEADLARINAILESQVRRAPEQYWWIHRRFKTRPPGEPPFYGSESRGRAGG